MEFIELSHRHALSIIKYDKEFNFIYEELTEVLKSISDKDLIEQFESRELRRGKSLADSINKLIDNRLIQSGWEPQSKIFKPDKYDSPWRLDFAKHPFSVEVAFNHGEATAWNLMKPVIASEINHVEKAINTEIGIVILATEELKKRGGFDSTVKSFESIGEFLMPLINYLTVPIVIIGLKAPKSFEIVHDVHPVKNTKLGVVKPLGRRIKK